MDLTFTLDGNKSVVEIREELADMLGEQNNKLNSRDAYELATFLTPYLTCPALKGKRTTPMSCMFCAYGHMTECHHPLDCNEARIVGKCSH